MCEQRAGVGSQNEEHRRGVDGAGIAINFIALFKQTTTTIFICAL